MGPGPGHDVDLVLDSSIAMPRMHSRLMHLLTAALLLIGLGRTAEVVFHKPLLGYANNWDFIKISSTLGVWADEQGVEPTAGHPTTPVSHYRTHGERFRELRYLSSELIFVSVAIVVADVLSFLRAYPRHALDLRTVGAVKTLFVLAVGGFLTLLFFQRAPHLGVLSAIIFAAVICDPFNTLYFNTLYFDDSAVMFGCLATGLALFLIATEQPPGLLMGIFCVALVLAGLSKMQHAGLPLAIALGYGAGRVRRLAGRENRRPGRALLLPLLTALLALGLGIVNNELPSMRGMVSAAAQDTWFGTVLPALKNPNAALTSLGVPERCAALVGKTSFSPEMQSTPCPEIFRLSRFQMVGLLLKEPSAMWRIAERAIPLTRPFIFFYGQVEGRSFGHIEDEGLRFASLGRWFGNVPTPFYVALFVLSLLGGLVSLVLLLRGDTLYATALSVLLNAVITSTLLACLLGDGYADLCRHFHVAQSALMIAPVTAILVLGRITLRRPLVRLKSSWRAREEAAP